MRSEISIHSLPHAHGMQSKNRSPITHFIEFAFESVVVEIIGDVLQLAVLVEIESGVVSESIDDLAVV